MRKRDEMRSESGKAFLIVRKRKRKILQIKWEKSEREKKIEKRMGEKVRERKRSRKEK